MDKVREGFLTLYDADCYSKLETSRAFQLIETACWAAKLSQGVPLGHQPATGGAKLYLTISNHMRERV
jgi:hypothetical protein